jgi:hypothetical protein
MVKEKSFIAELNCLIADLNTKLYSYLGLTQDELYNQTTATGLYQREVYKRLYGRYPEEQED